MDDVCRVCGMPIYLSVDRCPYCGEKYGNRHKTTDYNLINLCTVNELRNLCGLKDIWVFIIRIEVTWMDENIRRGRGRPKKDKCYDKVFKFLGKDEHEYMKTALEEELNKNGGEILRDALETLYRFEITLKGK